MLQLLILLLMVGCKNQPIDVSIPAAEANDLTLVMAIENEVNSGYALIRVNAGSEVNQFVNVIVPKGFKGEGLALGCESMEYPFAIDGTSEVIKLDVKNIIPHEAYPEKYRCDARILMQVDGKINDEVKTIRAVGVVNIISLSKGYSVMPIDSPYAAWKLKYKNHTIQYSTAGRSSVEAPSGK